VFAEEVLLLDGDSPFFRPIRPLLDAALRLDRSNDDYTWHGWQHARLSRFLASLPEKCSLIAGVWETLPASNGQEETERLSLGCILEVIEGQIRSVRSFDSLVKAGLKPVEQLEAGYEDALELMRLARAQVAPVAWALFIEKASWDEWVFTESSEGESSNKGEMLAELARRGRCVLMGSEVKKEMP
jgi:hypothetical protein